VTPSETLGVILILMFFYRNIQVIAVELGVLEYMKCNGDSCNCRTNQHSSVGVACRPLNIYLQLKLRCVSAFRPDAQGLRIGYSITCTDGRKEERRDEPFRYICLTSLPTKGRVFKR
jgi:hypothetical protein